MEHQEEQFTQRMLQRAGMKKNEDGTTNYSSLRRKLSIFKAMEESQQYDGRIIDSGMSLINDKNNSKKGIKPDFETNNNKILLNKNYPSTSISLSRAQAPFPEPVKVNCIQNCESENKHSRNEFVQEKKEFFEQKDNNFSKSETRPQPKITNSRGIYSQSSPDSDKSSLNSSKSNPFKKMLNDEDTNFESATDWQSIVKKCINTFSEKVETGSYNLSSRRGDQLTNFVSSGSIDLTYPKNDLNLLKNDLTLPRPDSSLSKLALSFPRPYGTHSNKMFKSKMSESSSSYVTENSSNDVSLPSYVNGFDSGEVSVFKHQISEIEQWRNPSEVFENSFHEEKAPQLYTVAYKTTPAPEKVTEFKTLNLSSEIKESILPSPISISQNPEELDASGTETGSVFSLTSAIKKLDEEIQNLQMRPEAKNLETEMKTPKKLFPLVDSEKSGYTPRKLFHKDFEDRESDCKRNIESKEDPSPEFERSLSQRKSSIFALKTPKSWKPKPNLESTRKASNMDLTCSKKTISPSQVGSTLSTITPNTPTSPEELQKMGPNTMESTIPSEVEQFLAQALGEEFYNTSITFDPETTRGRVNSHSNTSELISDNPTQRVQKSPKSEHSKDSTLNRTIDVYKSLSKRIKKKLRSAVKESVEPAWNPYFPIRGRMNEDVRRLLQEVNIQQTLICQASKALDYCHAMKEFQASPEEVETNRLILIANLRKNALLDEIDSLSSKFKTEKPFKERAEITLKDISLSLKEGIYRQERQSAGVIEWFIVVISQGLTVWDTRTITCPVNSPSIRFPGTLSIPELKPDFKISLKVYSMRLQSSGYKRAENYHIQKDEDHKSCPSPSKFLRRQERRFPNKSFEIKFSGIRDTSFLPVGVVDFHLHDLSLSSPWPLRAVPKESVLHGTIDLNLTCKLHLSISHSGFLTHGDEAGGFAVWNRRWCVLEGHTLMFWNYPREEETKKPLLKINLMDCVSKHVNTIERNLCARPRTFVIETSRRRNADDRDSIILQCRPACTIIRHLLQCDTLRELSIWLTKVNHVVTALREWNIIGRSKHRESDL